MVTGSGGHEVAKAPKAAGVVTLTMSVSDRGISGTMAEIPSATGWAAQRWWPTRIAQADCVRWRQPRSSSAESPVDIGSV
jgi:hypothetical protein